MFWKNRPNFPTIFAFTVTLSRLFWIWIASVLFIFWMQYRNYQIFSSKEKFYTFHKYMCIHGALILRSTIISLRSLEEKKTVNFDSSWKRSLILEKVNFCQKKKKWKLRFEKFRLLRVDLTDCHQIAPDMKEACHNYVIMFQKLYPEEYMYVTDE